MANKGKFNPEGFVECQSRIIQSLIMHKTVMCFDNFDLAKSSVIMEISNSVEVSNPVNLVTEIFEQLEQQTYLKEWFEEY